MSEINNPKYYFYLKLILEGNDLIFNYKDCYITIKDIKDNDIDVCNELRYNLKLTLFKIDYFNYTEHYSRKMPWKNDLEKLKIEHPNLFRKEKISKLLHE
jgi:hypothetical protein